MKIVTVEQMLAIERAADASGLSYDQMMHNAGLGIGKWIYQHVPVKHSVIGLIGSGNNGGDTIIALTWLAKRSVRTTAFLVKQREHDPLLDAYIHQGGAVVDISNHQHMHVLQAAIIQGAVVLDGVLGTGLKLPLRGTLHQTMVRISNQLENRLDVLKIAVDCPSGVDCDTGEVSDVTFAVDHTLTMAAVKQGLLRHPARSFSGEIHLIGIGIDEMSDDLNADFPQMVDEGMIRDFLPQRPDHGHKGTFGTCLVIAGSAPYTGAAYLTGKSAYRAGCGLVHMAAMKDVHRSLSGRLIEAVWTILPDVDGAYDPNGVEVIKADLMSADSIVIGPGWGQNKTNETFLVALLKSIPSKTPTLFDADGLKLLRKLDRWWAHLPNQTVLTPHPGEMAILTGIDIQEIQDHRWEIADEFAQKWNVVLVLKGAVSVIASPQEGVYVNPVSDSALGTAGSGDLLSGLIGGLMAQGISAQGASVLGVWVHGTSGQVAHSVVGTDFSVTATDILQHIPHALLKAKEAGIKTSL